MQPRVAFVSIVIALACAIAPVDGSIWAKCKTMDYISTCSDLCDVEVGARSVYFTGRVLLWSCLPSTVTDVFLMGKVICVGEPERKVRLHDGSCGREVQIELTKIPIVSTSTETVKLRTEENIFFQTTTGQGTETSRKTTTTEETSHVVVDIHLIPEQQVPVTEPSTSSTQVRPDWPSSTASGPNIIINNNRDEGEGWQMPSFALRVLEYVGWFAAFVAAIVITSCVVTRVLSEQLRAALTGVTGVVRRASLRRSRGTMERPSWLPARETDVSAAAAATALNPRAPLSTFRATPTKREVVLEMSPVAVLVPGVPRLEPTYDPVPQPRPINPAEDRAAKGKGTLGPIDEQVLKQKVSKVLDELKSDVAVMPPPPPPLPTRNISDINVVRTGSTCPTWRNPTERPGKIVMAKAAASERVHSPTREEITSALDGLRKVGRNLEE